MATRRLAAVGEDHVPHATRLAEVEAFAESLPDDFLRCRELNHNWMPFTVTINKNTHGIRRVLRCSRCKCRKFQDLTSRGGIVRSYYEHPEGYLHKGQGQIVGEARDILRLTSIFRGKILEVDDDAQMPRPKPKKATPKPATPIAKKTTPRKKT